MKKNFVIGILFTFVIFACEKEEVNERFDFGMEKSFKIEGNYNSADNHLKFNITEINDSTGKITLSTFDNLMDTVGNYSFELKDVLPYPISTETIELEEYEVTLKILEL